METKTTKGKQEELLLAYIDIPYFRNNPAYIERWRTYFQAYKDPHILLLMYHKHISTLYHWIYLELSEHFLRKNEPQIAHFVLSEAVKANVYDSTRIAKALERIPPFEKKYSKGDMLGLLNMKNIQALGKTWNRHEESFMYLVSPPGETPERSVSYEIEKIRAYEAKYAEANTGTGSGVEDAIAQPDIKQEPSGADEKEELTKIIEMSEDLLAVCPTNNDSCVADQIEDANQSVSFNREEDNVLVDIPVEELKQEASESLHESHNCLQEVPEVLQETPESPQEETPESPQETPESPQETPEILQETPEDCVIYSSSFIGTQDINEEGTQSHKRPKPNGDSIFEPEFLEVPDVLEPNTEIRIGQYIYLMQHVSSGGAELLRIAKNSDITQTMVGKVFFLRKSSYAACRVLKDAFGFAICKNATSHFIIQDYNRLTDLKAVMAGLSTYVRCFYLRCIVERILPLIERGYVLEDPLDFFIDHEFALGFNCIDLVVANPGTLTSTVNLLKENLLGPEDELTLDASMITRLGRILAEPPSKREITKHKMDVLHAL